MNAVTPHTEIFNDLLKLAVDSGGIAVVRADRSQLRRALLNLGHTGGHALEAHGGYGRWLHGEAGALGVVAELEAGARLGWTPPAVVERARALLSALGLPTQVERAELAASWPYVGSDKKRAGGVLRLPVVAAPGEARVERVRLVSLRLAVLPT